MGSLLFNEHRRANGKKTRARRKVYIRSLMRDSKSSDIHSQVMRVTEPLTERYGETMEVRVCVWVGSKVAGAKSTTQRGNWQHNGIVQWEIWIERRELCDSEYGNKLDCCSELFRIFRCRELFPPGHNFTRITRTRKSAGIKVQAILSPRTHQRTFTNKKNTHTQKWN